MTGILWVFGYFATKEEFHALRDTTSSQNKSRDCWSLTHGKLFEGELQSKVSRDELKTLRAAIKKKTPGQEFRKNTPIGVQVSEIDTDEIINLEMQMEEANRKLVAAEKSVSDANQAIMSKECDK